MNLNKINNKNYKEKQANVKKVSEKGSSNGLSHVSFGLILYLKKKTKIGDTFVALELYHIIIGGTVTGHSKS